MSRIGNVLKEKMIIATYVDVTKEKKAVEDAVGAKRHFISILDNIPDIAWLKDKEGRFIAVNKPFGVACGFKPEDIVGKTDLDVWPEEPAKKYMADDFEVMSSRATRRFEYALFNAAGRRRWIETVKTPTYDNQGRIEGVTGISRDITKRKEAEDFLRKAKNDLEQIVSERTKVLEETVRKLTGEIFLRKQAEDALRVSESQYRALSILDGLTGLYNARHFFSLLESEIRRAERYGRPLSLLLMDVDNFKKYNDSFGHLEGDKVLARLAEVIRRNLRSSDAACRYGGEEFVVILPETTGERGAQFADRIRDDFAREAFRPVEGGEIRVSVSIGVARFSSGKDAAAFVKEADANMYWAKRHGKNRVCFCQGTAADEWRDFDSRYVYVYCL
jgi:diguanylate cyclase (GGDEF)-like protein/PAS domain S-box-containing protein